jgi:hypothetical protein
MPAVLSDAYTYDGIFTVEAGLLVGAANLAAGPDDCRHYTFARTFDRASASCRFACITCGADVTGLVPDGYRPGVATTATTG